jgi:hypothetical protein
MGLEFLERTAKPFDRACQLGFERLQVAYVFDPNVAATERSFLAKLGSECVVAPGENVVLRLIDEGITLFKNEQAVGKCATPPKALYKIIQEKGGVAVGQLSTLHMLSKSADVVVL